MEDNFPGFGSDAGNETGLGSDVRDEIGDLVPWYTCCELPKIAFIAHWHREQVEQPSDYIAVPTFRIYGTIDDAFPDAILDIPAMCLDSFFTRFQPADEFALSPRSDVSQIRFNTACMK